MAGKGANCRVWPAGEPLQGKTAIPKGECPFFGGEEEGTAQEAIKA